MTFRIMEKIKEKYEVTEIPLGELASLKANGMRFEIQAYEVKGLGHLSVMRASGFFGLMKMDTVIINPKQKDMPLYSYDRIFVLGNDTLIVELYDTVLNGYSEKSLLDVKDEYKDLCERDPGEHWYDSIKLSSSISKKTKKKDTPRMDELTIKHLLAYLSADSNGVDDVAMKNEKSAVYVNGLLQKGGPSTDVFKKALGQEKTELLFKKALFGID